MPPDPRVARWGAIAVGCLLVLAALAIYAVTYVDRYYDHFVWQAAAFLEGHAAIRYPVEAANGLNGNAWFQDVLPIATTDGIARGLLPFPPLPALVLLPFVALWGLATNDQAIFTVLAAVDVAICWWAIGRLPVGPAVRLGTTVFFAFGTVFWYTAQTSTTWYQAHIVAVGLTFLAIGLAVRADPAAVDGEPRPSTGLTSARRLPGALAIDPRQFVVGLLFGLACTARLSVVFGAPFFAFVGSGDGWRRRAWSAGLGAAVPILGLVLFDVVATGQIVNPAYDHLYRLETAAYPGLGYHADWGIEDPRYLLQNLGIALFGVPDILPARLPDALAVAPVPVCTDSGALRGLFDVSCPLAVPRDTGMSVLLTSPAYLLAIPVLGLFSRSRIVTGAVLAVGAIALFDLIHFSQGWVQFGYRFSNDAAPFAVVLVALGFERLAVRRRWGMLLGMSLVVVSLAINAWGVIWSRSLGW
ncbi:MAG: hypothetical protein A2Z32_06235 [Chloroflexi bacterium RBG_16_69_14]|nr:MAG: hypothetical protein A2Z32_06235 [Chloroflexi bacterium RBG_16_69_14]